MTLPYPAFWRCGSLMSRVETREWLNKLLDVLTGYIREKSRRSSSSESTRFQPDDARA
jgi:hypothetical protein